MVFYLDEARSIDARRTMSMALQNGQQANYQGTVDWPNLSFPGEGAYLQPTLAINVQWPPVQQGLVQGSVLFRYPGSDGIFVEQTLELRGTPAKVGGWQWQFHCPDTDQFVRTLYLTPDGQRFQSREAAGLKSRRLSAVDRLHRDYLRLSRQLQTDGPLIAKPANMTEQTYDQLYHELEKAHVRWLCAALGRPEPDFFDDKPNRPKPACKSKPKSSSARGAPPQLSFRSAARNLAGGAYFRDQSGALKLRSKSKKQFGVPELPRATKART
jgi:hypothetical protein